MEKINVSGKRINVIIVEDEDAIALAIKTIVQKYFDCRLLERARNGEEGWDKLMKDDYDLIIADWNMPKKTGDELLLQVRADEKTKDIPFLMLTARSDKDSIITAVQAGTSEYIVKPFQTGMLVNKIEKLLRK